MCQQFQTDIYFLIQRPISTFLIKYYGYKGDTQIVLIKGVNATDMMEETEIEAKPETLSYIHLLDLSLFWHNLQDNGTSIA
jgi:hypothetical protein